ncbi:MAG: ATP-binding protein [Gammaproteobacteria bacterium]|nr:ATP-binding protein [Gammaproteobacteria bacterium]
MIDRTAYLTALRRRLDQFPVVAIIGARQVGKTTLARQLARSFRGPTRHFDLENPEDLQALREPMLVLRELRGLVVIDEIQHLPGLFKTLRVLADRPRRPARFLVLGSASMELLRQSSESLAGRISYCEIDGFAIGEVGIGHLDRLWLRGGFPRSYTASSNDRSMAWREDFLRTFVERDMPQLGFRTPAETLRRFWTMLAHWHGQVWNASEFGRALGFSDHTVRRYLDALSSALVIRQLRPWHANVARRQVKSPKVYVTDSGLMHALLKIRSHADLISHPKVGASWEGFMIGEIIQHLGIRSDEAHFWSTHAGAELDLLIVRGTDATGFEIKRTVAPQVTPSMRSALDVLKLRRLYVIHAGEHTFPLADTILAVSCRRLIDDIPLLR